MTRRDLIKLAIAMMGGKKLLERGEAMMKVERTSAQVPYSFFPISYWVGPPAEYSTDERYKEIAECNFTLTFGGDINLSHKHGMKCLVFDDRIFKALAKPGVETDAGIEAAVKDYAKHPAFFGFFLKDEPNSRDFPALAHVNQRLLALDPKGVPYINLFPTYATQEQLGNPTYEEHVEQFLTIVKPKVLSYDHYALLQGRDRPDYFLNMEIIRAKALKYGVPFWFILLSTPHYGYRTPSEGDLRWQVFTALAYGAKGIMYFTYWTVNEKGWGDGIIKSDGTRTERYEIVKAINSEVKALGETLLQLTSRKVYHTTAQTPIGASPPDKNAWVQKVEGGDLVVGELQDAEGKPFLFVTNASHDEAVEATVNLRAKVKAIHEVSKSAGAKPTPLKVRHVGRVASFTLRLSAGDGKLLAITL